MKKPIEVRVTKEGFENFKQEQAKLLERRPGVLARMVVARDQGDLSENAGYHAAKEELGNIDRRLRYLKLMIRFADVIEGGGDIVTLGSTVVVDNGSGAQEFRIVGKTEANPMEGKMSEASPIGAALLGKKIGESVIVDVPDGQVTYKIKKVK